MDFYVLKNPNQDSLYILDGAQASDSVYTWIRLSRVACSWLLDRTLVSSCRGGLARAEGAGPLSVATAIKLPAGLVCVNTLGDSSRVGATVAGIL